GDHRTSIYGLGEWREEVDANGNAILISSPSWAGAYPWIDKKNHVYGFLLARVSNQKNKFNPFYSSPVLPIMVRDILTNRVKVVSDMKRIILGILIIAPLISTAQYVGQHQGEVSVTTKFPVKAYSFDLQDVQLLDSRFKQNMDREGQWMLSLPVERLLHSFYVNAGM